MSNQSLGLRITLATLAALAALVLLFNFQTPPDPLAKLPAITIPTPVGPTIPGQTAAPGSILHSGTFSGATVTTYYGSTEVVITVAAGRITDVQAPILPRDRNFSDQISTYVAPIFRQEALSAQSAQINAVSGATYTSYAYAQSLQSAIDKAKA